MKNDGDEFKPVDLRTRRLAREIEDEIGGLFGIDYRDIERALERMQAGVPALQACLPAPVQKTLRLLDLVQDQAASALAAGDAGSVQHIIEILENYRRRLVKMLEG